MLPIEFVTSEWALIIGQIDGIERKSRLGLVSIERGDIHNR